MAFGLGVLRLPPAHFWAMTPRELAACMAPYTGPQALGRGDLERLMRAFPD